MDSASSHTKVFDCFLYSGEEDVLEIRFNELWDVVDAFVIVEANRTFAGAVKAPTWNPNSLKFSKFASKVRHVVVKDKPEGDDPFKREAWQRDAVLRGVPDAEASDLIVISDVDEIPQASTLEALGSRRDAETFGLQLAFFYFFVNYRNTVGPESQLTWSVAVRRHVLDKVSPNDIRYGVRDGSVEAIKIPDAGWHFSYLSNIEGIKRKLNSFSHQELNTQEVIARININKIIKQRRDLFDRPGFTWDVVKDGSLPAWLKANKDDRAHLFYGGKSTPRPASKLGPWFAKMLGPPKTRRQPPMIICPYFHDTDPEVVDEAFGLSTSAGKTLPFYLWKDSEGIGPERAFQHCWDQHPDRDVVIVHTDMAPTPEDRRNNWFDALIAQRDELETAGLIGCNLYYPERLGGGLQCAGGIFTDGKISHLTGSVGSRPGLTQQDLGRVRKVDWVTFGGVLIRREAINACGDFDNRYEWAYVMDVDYSFEARLRGFDVFQVPVSLDHQENGTTGAMLREDPERQKQVNQNVSAFTTKWEPFSEVLGSNFS